MQKLKDARSEAAKEIEAYKAKKDEEFKKFESEVSGIVLSHLAPSFIASTSTTSKITGVLYYGYHAETQNSSNKSTSQSTIDQSTKTQLADIEKAIKQNKDEVIKKIVERVIKCEPGLHPNLKKIEA